MMLGTGEGEGGNVCRAMRLEGREKYILHIVRALGGGAST